MRGLHADAGEAGVGTLIKGSGRYMDTLEAKAFGVTFNIEQSTRPYELLDPADYCPRKARNDTNEEGDTLTSAKP